MDERSSDSISLNTFQPNFMQETDFDNFFSAIHGDSVDPIESFSYNYACNHFTDCCTDLQLLPPPSYEGVPGAGSHVHDVMGRSYSNLTWNKEGHDMKVSEVVFGDDNSCETVTAGGPDIPRTTAGGLKGDRTRTLISERKRRRGMKENLYALRLLVPHITKMDKASIVGDAARYIEHLQNQAKTLRSEIATIEAAKKQQLSSQSLKKIPLPISKKISKMEMFQVEDKECYVKLVCNKGKGVAVSLQRALESITSFQVQSSNLATVDHDFVLTFTINVGEFYGDLSNLRLWLAGAFVKQGFEFTTFPST